MRYPSFSKKIVEEEGSKFSLSLLKLENAVLLFIGEGETRFGTLAVAMPPPQDGSVTSISSVLLGNRNPFVARFFAERVAEASGKMSFVSLYLKNKAADLRWLPLKTVQKFIESEMKRLGGGGNDRA